MAFQPPNSGQERQNRKILEQLEEQKKRLRLQTQPGNNAPAVAIGSAVPVPPSPIPGSNPLPPVSGNPAVAAMVMPDTQAMTAAQRTALQHANANSVGYFITQDSSFGNLILPVLPRFEKIPQ